MVACEAPPARGEGPRVGRGPAMAFAAAAGALVLVGAVALAVQQQGRAEVQPARCCHSVPRGVPARARRVPARSPVLCAAPADSTATVPAAVPAAVQLFGVDAVGPMSGADVSSYGPAVYTPDRAMRRAERARENSLPLSGSGGRRSAPSELAELGPEAAAKLHSSAFAEALREMRAAPKDTARGPSAGRTEVLAQAAQSDTAHAAANEGGGMEKRFGWHPGRHTFARGSGEGLIESGATQQALKEMRAHAVRFHSASPPSAKEQYKAARALSLGPERLFETELWNDAGFGRRPEGRGPEEAEHEFSLSGLRGHKMARVAEEGEHPKGAHGRSWNRALSRDANKLQQIRTAIDLKETDMHSLQNEERARAMEAKDLEQHALGIERKEMAAYGQAEMQRNDALRLAHKLLVQKKHARALERKVKFEEHRVKDSLASGLKLEKQGKAEEKAFEDMTGPIKKAQEDVHIANQAYTKSELALATAETTAERLATHPKLAQEAMARIKKLRKQSAAMANLVKTASARLHTLQNANGPSSFTDGIDSHFESPKKRGVRDIQKARNIQEKVDAFKAKVERKEDAIKARLPALHAQIRAAKKLHTKYLQLHNSAEAAQRKADTAKVQDLKLKRQVQFDATVLHNVKKELQEDRGRYAAMTRH